MADQSLDDILAGTAPDHRVLMAPDGRHFIVLQALEAANSQWVEAGTLYDANRTLLVQLGEWNWHIDGADWTRDDGVTLSMRRFPGDAPGLVLRLDLSKRLALLPDGSAAAPFAELNDWLEEWYRQHRGER